MIKDKRILITGGGGFIGSALAKRLSPHNDVTVLDLSFNFSQSIDNDIDAIVADIRNLDEIAELVRCNQIIIHTAARLGVQNVIDSIKGTLDTNYTGTANMLQAVSESSCCERFVYFSTSEVFGDNSTKITEDSTSIFPSIGNSRWCYGVGKLAAEYLVLGYHQSCGLPTTIIRPFNVFGAGRTGDYAILRFIRQALSGEDIVIHGDGLQVRAWCYIDDFCDAIISSLSTKEAIGESFNIGNPKNTTDIFQLAYTVKSLCQSKSNIVCEPTPYIDISSRVPNIEHARNILEFNPSVSLVEGLKRTIEWVMDNDGKANKAN